MNCPDMFVPFDSVGVLSGVVRDHVAQRSAVPSEAVLCERKRYCAEEHPNNLIYGHYRFVHAVGTLSHQGRQPLKCFTHTKS